MMADTPPLSRRSGTRSAQQATCRPPRGRV